ncbi:hypothetical protein LXL04_016638 [Taraxacum kok-saghyz]
MSTLTGHGEGFDIAVVGDGSGEEIGVDDGGHRPSNNIRFFKCELSVVEMYNTAELLSISIVDVDIGIASGSKTVLALMCDTLTLPSEPVAR